MPIRYLAYRSDNRFFLNFPPSLFLTKPNKMMSYKLWMLLFVAFTLTTLTAQNDVLVRYPAVSPDGNLLAFSWQGDIWTSNIDGSDARRLTIHESYESAPVWSLDGQQIAFVGQRYGNPDIFVMTKDGRNMRRLTYYSGGDGSISWDEDGNIYFATNRAFATVERQSEVYMVSSKGGTPHRVTDGTVLRPAISPSGKYVAWVRGTCRQEREAYTGPANRNVWLYDMKKGDYTAIANNPEQESDPKWAGDDQLFYLSAKNGKYNIYSVAMKNGKASEPKTITNEKEMGLREYSVSADGKTLAYTQGKDLYVIQNGTAKKINIAVPSDERFDPVRHQTFRSGVNEYDFSPNGELVAYVIRGEVFLSEADKEKPRAVNLSDHPYRERDVIWQNDSVLLFTSDRDGNYDIYKIESSDPNQKNLFKTFKRKTTKLTNTPDEERNLTISPDGKHLAYIRGIGDFIIQPINEDGTMGAERILLTGWNAPSSVSWSPDGKYVAYSRTNLNFNSEIYIQPIDGSREPVNVSMHPRGDYSPVWSADGSKLGFTSIRNNGNSDVWFAWLKEEDYEKSMSDWKEMDEPKDKKKGKKEVKVEIDFDNIHERLRQVTYLPGNEGNLAIDGSGEYFYFSTNRGSRAGAEGDSDFMKIKWDGTKASTVLPKNRIFGVSSSNDGNTLYFISRGKINKIGVKEKKPTAYSYTAKMDIHRKAEMEQIFEEAWRVLKDGFYDPNFHGNDWNELKATYKPIALSASTIQDFRVLYNEMLGQLNASHMGLRGSSTPETTQREQSGVLGIEVKPVKNGVEITTIVPNTPADKKASKLNVGDVITAINGEEIGNRNYYELMLGTSGERILLNIKGADGKDREVIIRPTSSIRGQLYNTWVKERKALTEKYSNGQLGYIHIQGMNWNSFERFERELTASAQGKKGIVIDVRFNGGGWTTDMLMAVLNVRQHSYTVPRGAVESLEKENKEYTNYYPYGERLPLAAWTGPAITLCNQNSYSNAEIFSHAFKTLDRGTLVGMPTFGAVISTGSGGLIDGSYVRRPFRAWYVKATGENMEHGPAVPDVEVENAPNYRAIGEDAQLRKAVEVLLGEMKN